MAADDFGMPAGHGSGDDGLTPRGTLGAAQRHDRLTPCEVLAAIPHGPPFRFVEEILDVDDERIVAACRFDANADFYRGHFPGNPITPGVLLLEAMAQAGVVAHGIYLLGRAKLEAGSAMLTLFTQAEAEFLGIVAPGERVLVNAQKLTFRHRMLRSRVTMTRADGTVVCEATLTGVGVKNPGTGPGFSSERTPRAVDGLDEDSNQLTSHGAGGLAEDSNQLTSRGASGPDSDSNQRTLRDAGRLHIETASDAGETR